MNHGILRGPNLRQTPSLVFTGLSNRSLCVTLGFNKREKRRVRPSVPSESHHCRVFFSVYSNVASAIPSRLGLSGRLVEVNFVCNFLQDFNIRCDVWDLSGNPITDEGLLRIARHVTAETGPALRIDFNGTQVTVFGFQWLLTILSVSVC